MEDDNSLQKKLKGRCFRNRQPLTNSPEYLKRQVSDSGGWGPDWSEFDRAATCQAAWEEFIRTQMRPEATGTFYSPDRLSPDEFKRRFEDLRNKSAKLHPDGNRPSRPFRKFEYLLALECGAHPKKARYGRWHAHALLYNLGKIELGSLALAWSELNGEQDGSGGEDHECALLKRYDGDEHDVELVSYCLKTAATDLDLTSISRKLRSQRRETEPQEGAQLL